MVEKYPKRNRNFNKPHRIITIAATLQNMNKSQISSDVTGSYTGTAQTGEPPEQDADDL